MYSWRSRHAARPNAKVRALAVPMKNSQAHVSDAKYRLRLIPQLILAGNIAISLIYHEEKAFLWVVEEGNVDEAGDSSRQALHSA